MQTCLHEGLLHVYKYMLSDLKNMSNINIQNIINKNKVKADADVEAVEIKQVATRVGFGEGLLLAGKVDANVVVLCADLTESTFTHLFKEVYPKRFVEMGVAEQNMASVASGMAAMGKVPFIASYAMFSPGRNWEQIRTTIAYNNVPVKIVGAHAGLSVGPDGGTHQALEDIALMRVVPGMIVVVPCDAIEAKKATLAIAKNGRPSYIRLAREKSPVITLEEEMFEIGKANIMYESEAVSKNKIGIIACGEMVSRAINCASELESSGIDVGIMNLHTIKPIDSKAIVNFVNKYEKIATIEEHQVAGGMGSAVLECIALNSKDINFANFKIEMIGVQDKFGQSGQREELFEYYGINEKAIVSKIKKLL
jgi:transketolase